MKNKLLWFLLLCASAFGQRSTTNLTAQNQCAQVGIDYTRSSTIAIDVSGTFSATLQPQVAINGQSARNVQVTPSTSQTPQSTITAVGGYQALQIAGYDLFQVCATSYASGTATVNLSVSAGTVGTLGGASGGGGVTSVSNSDGTLNISPTTGAVVASLALSHANTWAALQTFGSNASIAATAHGVLLSQNTAAATATAVGATNTVLNGNTGADPTFGAVPAGAESASVVQTGQTNVYGAFLQDFTSGTMELPEGAGFVTNVNSTVGFDTTTQIEKLWGPGGVDTFNVVTGATDTTVTHVIHATATAGLYTSSAIANADLPNGGTAHAVSVVLACEAASASGTAYTCTTSPSFVPADLDTVLFEADVANTASATLAVNGATAATIKRLGGSANLAANDLLAGEWTLMTFDGTNWQMHVLANAVVPNAANAGSGAFTLDAHLTTSANGVRVPEQSACTSAGFAGDICANTTGHQVHLNTNGADSIAQTRIVTQTDTITGADYTNTTVTPSTVFSFTLPATTAAANYKYDCSMLWESTAATLVGPVFGLNLSAAPTQLTGLASVQNTLAGADVNGYLSNTTTGSQTLVTSSAAGVTSTNYWAHIWGTIEGAAVAGSTFIINAASTSGTTANLNIRRGGICTLTWIN